MEKISYYLSNWKTNLSAMFVLGCVGLRLSGYIDGSQLADALGVLVAYGFIVSKDASSKDLK